MIYIPEEKGRGMPPFYIPFFINEQDGTENQKTINSRKKNYARGFGVAFLIFFILLFFPGFGVSSSGAKSKENKSINES